MDNINITKYKYIINNIFINDTLKLIKGFKFKFKSLLSY